MASGTGRFVSQNYAAGTSSTGVKLTVDVSQSVNATTRKATITVHAMMSFYRISGQWDITNGTAIINDSGVTNIVANLGGVNSTQYDHLTLKGATSFRAYAGGNYCQADGPNWPQGDPYVKSGSTGKSETTITDTFDFDAAGNPISKTWSATLNFRGTQMYLNGTVVTDGIQSLSKFYGSVNSQAKKITKLYGSVNGQAKEIKKLYGSVNGQAKIVFQV